MQYIGIVGAGDVSGKNCVALLEDFIGDETLDVTVVFAVDASWHESHDDIYDWSQATNSDDDPFPYVAVFDQDAAKDKDLKLIIDGAKESVKVTRVSRKVVEILEENDGILALLWDPTNEHPGDPAYDALVAADERGVKAFDLSDGWERISFNEVEEDTSPTSEVSEEREVLPEPPTFPESIHHGPTREKLEAMKRPELKKLAEEEGLDLPDRAHTATLLDALLQHFETRAPAETPQDAPGEPVEVSVSTETSEGPISQETQAEQAHATAVINLLPTVLDQIKSGIEATQQDIRSRTEAAWDDACRRIDGLQAWSVDFDKKLDEISQQLATLIEAATPASPARSPRRSRS